MQGNFDQLIYQITEGVDRGRARAYGGVEDTKTWKNSFIFTGEEPITKVNSGGGSKNRVIEIAIDGLLIEDGHYVRACPGALLDTLDGSLWSTYRKWT